jgi:hypothetical protein
VCFVVMDSAGPLQYRQGSMELLELAVWSVPVPSLAEAQSVSQVLAECSLCLKNS